MSRLHHLSPDLALSKNSASSAVRDSNVLRASVLDAALELGVLDSNSAVADWIFNDPSQEILETSRPSESTKVEFTTDMKRGKGGDTAGYETGYDTDSGPFYSKPSKLSTARAKFRFFSKYSKPDDSTGYETDDTHISSSSKRKRRYKSIFRLKSKSSVDLEEGSKGIIPKTPALPLWVTGGIGYDHRTNEKYVTLPDKTKPKSKSFIRKRATSVTDSHFEDDGWELVSSALSIQRMALQSPKGEAERYEDTTPLTPTLMHSDEKGEPFEESSHPVGRSTSHSPPPEAPSGQKDLPIPQNDDTTQGKHRHGLFHQRFSFAIPHSGVHSPTAKRRRTIPNLPPLFAMPYSRSTPHSPANSPLHSPVGHSSLPPSPYLLVTPIDGLDVEDHTPSPAHPYVVVSPVDTIITSAQSSTTATNPPVFPLSLSKVWRRSIIDHHDIDITSAPANNAFSRPISFDGPYTPPPPLLSAPAELNTVTRTSHLFNQPIPPIKRGREAPFPTHPILPLPLSLGMYRSTDRGFDTFNARLGVRRRYRELYAIPHPPEVDVGAGQHHVHFGQYDQEQIEE